MASEPEDPKSPPPGLLERARLPVVFLLAFLLALGGYYFFYVEKKASYLMGRNFRLLATFGDGLNTSLVSRGKVFDAYIKGRARPGDLSSPKVPGFSHCVWDPVTRKSWHQKGETLISLVEHPVNHLAFVHFDKSAVSSQAAVGCELGLRELLNPLFDFKGAFDAVLLVEPDGDVVYQHDGPALGVTRLGLDSRKSSQGASEKAAVQSFRLLGSAVDGRNVVLGGRDYKLFVEPLHLPITDPEGSVDPWFLCGIVSADKFVYKSMAVSSSLLLLTLAALLLAALAWPLMKLKLLGERQRVRLRDVLLLGACSVLGVSILTLSLLDFFAYRELKETAAGQLQGFASSMAMNVEREISAANRKLTQLQALAASTPSRSMTAYLKSARSTKVPSPETKPYSWIDFSLIDDKGMQNLKWTPADDESLPKVDVWERPYFQRTRDGDTTTYPAAAEGEGRAFVESVTAWTSALHQGVMALPITDPRLLKKNLVVATLGIPMHSVIGPLTPPGFEFAVIDDQGKVLFHSNSARNGIEDFFAETDADPHLHSAVFARHREGMDLRYFGEDYGAAVEPVPGLPWTVVALRNKDMLRSLNMQWLVTSLLFLLLLVICPLVVAVLFITLVRPRYRAPWIWPDPARPQKYFHLAALLAIEGLASGLALRLLPPGKQVLGLVSILPWVALATSYAVLERKRNGSEPSRGGAITRAYPLAALMLLVMTIVLPAAGVFASVQRIELHSFVRHGQLRLARGLGEFLKKPRAVRSGSAPPCSYASSFFATRIEIADDKGPCETGGKEDLPLPELLESLLPHYSPNSSEMRELLHERASDCSWDAHQRQEGNLELHSRVDEIRLISRLTPPVSTENELTHAGFLSWIDEAPGGLLFGMLVVGTLLYALVLFISRRLFLLGLLEPVWDAQQANPALPALIAGRNLFLVSSDRLTPEEAEGLKLLDLGKIDPAAKDWAALRREILDSKEDVLVAGFEHQILERSVNARTLILLEDLAEQHERTVVILSRVSPRRLLDAQKGAAARPEAARWRSLLAKFTVVEEDFRCRSTRNRPGFFKAVLDAIFPGRRVPAPAAESPALPPILKEESGSDPFLLKIGRGLLPHSHGMDDEQLLEEFGERAESHYREIWESCSMDEKVVLQHLAEEGWVNGKSRRVIRRLMASGLIRREPNFCLMNETFRRFVASPFCRGEADALEQRAKPSAWDRLKWPFLCILAATIAFVLATQQELLDSTTALVTGLAAGLPAVAKLVDLLNGRRAAAAKAG